MHHLLLRLILSCIALLTGFASAQPASQQVMYSPGEIQGDRRYDDMVETLCTALEKTRAQFGPYECRSNGLIQPKRRVLQELAGNSKNISVIWNPTSPEYERVFLPVKIPLRKGLLGSRVAFIRREDQEKFSQIRSLNDLREFTVGQGTGWTDNQFYQASGIPLVTAPYGQLLQMLANKRFDLLPRSVLEIGQEKAMAEQASADLVIEKTLLLVYPLPYYFFVNKHDTALQKRLEAGLQMMQKDGSLDAIFNKYHAAEIEKLDLRHRRIIRISNPAPAGPE